MVFFGFVWSAQDATCRCCVARIFCVHLSWQARFPPVRHDNGRRTKLLWYFDKCDSVCSNIGYRIEMNMNTCMLHAACCLVVAAFLNSHEHTDSNTNQHVRRASRLPDPMVGHKFRGTGARCLYQALRQQWCCSIWGCVNTWSPSTM